jgi:hypothetical protein
VEQHFLWNHPGCAYKGTRFGLKAFSAALGRFRIKNLGLLLRCLKSAELSPNLNQIEFYAALGYFRSFKSLSQRITASPKMIGVSNIRGREKWKARITINGKRVCGWNCKRAEALSSPADSAAIFFLVKLTDT